MKPSMIRSQKYAYESIGIFLAFSIVILGGLSCTPAKDEKTSGIKADQTFQLTILGQSLIEHDLRLHSPASVKEIASALKETDVCFSNLEVAIWSTENSKPTKEGIYFHAADPSVLDCLKEIGINMLAMSNNHAWDLGTSGILGTIEEIEKRGFTHAGTGSSAADASSPGFLDTPAGRVALIAMASGKFSQEAIAQENHPGVNVLRLEEDGNLNQEDSFRNLNSIRSTAEEADYVLVYHHNHYWESDKTKTPLWQRQWAHSCIDAGASVFIGHGVPLLHGIEIYNGCPIFYSLGNFIFHTKTDVGHYEPEVWQSVIVECLFQEEKLSSMKIIPIVLNEEGQEGDLFFQTRGVPRLAEGIIAEEIISRLSRISSEFGTKFTTHEHYAELNLIE